MYCPQCSTEYRKGFTRCADCDIPLVDRLPELAPPASSKEADRKPEDGDLDAQIYTGLCDPVAIGLAQSLLEEARIPFFAMGQNVVNRQESGDFLGFWSVRVPKARQAEAREILDYVAAIK